MRTFLRTFSFLPAGETQQNKGKNLMLLQVSEWLQCVVTLTAALYIVSAPLGR